MKQSAVNFMIMKKLSKIWLSIRVEHENKRQHVKSNTIFSASIERYEMLLDYCFSFNDGWLALYF